MTTVTRPGRLQHAAMLLILALGLALFAQVVSMAPGSSGDSMTDADMSVAHASHSGMAMTMAHGS